MAITDVEAKRIVDELGDELGLTPEERLAVRLVAKHETKYSAAWKGEGVGSFNMGAGTTTSSVPGEYFTHGDSRFDPATGKVVPYTTKFAKHPNAKAGFQYLAGQLLFEQGNVRRPRRANVAAALRNRSIVELATAMRMNRYYLGVKPLAESIDDYTAALRRAYADVKADTGETLFDNPKAPSSSDPTGSSEAPASPGGSQSSESPRSYLRALSRSLPALRRGNRGDLVEVLQFELGLEPDGIFGPVTERRLFDVQREAGFETEVSAEGKPLPLGCCGSKTWALLFADNLSGEDDEPLERMADLRTPGQQAELERDWNDDDGNPAA